MGDEEGQEGPADFSDRATRPLMTQQITIRQPHSLHDLQDQKGAAGSR